MEHLKEKLNKLLELSGLHEPVMSVDEEGRKVSITVNEGEWFSKELPRFVQDLDYMAKMMARKEGGENVFVDVNGYRRERERIIVELAKAAARKAMLKKEAIGLPAMNAYERRLIHSELATRPDVKTESLGEGKERHVVVSPI